MKTELTERYMWAVVRTLPRKQRPVVEGELRGRLESMIGQRVAAGVDAQTAEREAVLELGDPDRRAASWAKRSMYLIGPTYFFHYLRLLKLLMGIVVPIAAVAVLLGEVVSGGGIGESIAAAIVAAINVAIQVAFWVTVVFAIIEHTTTGEKPLTTWTPDRLSKVPSRSRVTITATVIGAVGLLIFAGAIVWQQFSSLFLDAASMPIPLLTPALWTFWLPYFLLLIAFEIGLLFINFVQRRWTWRTAIVHAALALAFTVPALWLLNTERLLNPEFLPMAERATALHLEMPGFYVVTTVIVIVVELWNIIDGFLKAGGANRDLVGVLGGIPMEDASRST